jgi:hypothetical protein
MIRNAWVQRKQQYISKRSQDLKKISQRPQKYFISCSFKASFATF